MGCIKRACYKETMSRGLLTLQPQGGGGSTHQVCAAPRDTGALRNSPICNFSTDWRQYFTSKHGDESTTLVKQSGPEPNACFPHPGRRIKGGIHHCFSHSVRLQSSTSSTLISSAPGDVLQPHRLCNMTSAPTEAFKLLKVENQQPELDEATSRPLDRPELQTGEPASQDVAKQDKDAPSGEHPPACHLEAHLQPVEHQNHRPISTSSPSTRTTTNPSLGVTTTSSFVLATISTFTALFVSSLTSLLSSKTYSPFLAPTLRQSRSCLATI